MINKLNFNEEDETSVERFFRKIRLSIFRTYFMIINQQFSMNTLYIILMTFETMQIVSLISYNTLYFDITQKGYLQTIKYLAVLNYINYFNSASIAMYGLIVLFLCHILILANYYINDLKSNQH